MLRDIDITGPKTTQQDLACPDVPSCAASFLYVNLHFLLVRREFFFVCNWETHIEALLLVVLVASISLVMDDIECFARI